MHRAKVAMLVQSNLHGMNVAGSASVTHSVICLTCSSLPGVPPFPTFMASSWSMHIAAWECTTLDSEPSSATMPGNAASTSALGIWARNVIVNFSASARSTCDCAPPQDTLSKGRSK